MTKMKRVKKFKSMNKNCCKYINEKGLSPVAYKGVFVSLNPLKTPCMARERRTAGEPSALNVKYFLAGVSMGEPCSIQDKNCHFPL